MAVLRLWEVELGRGGGFSLLSEELVLIFLCLWTSKFIVRAQAIIIIIDIVMEGYSSKNQFASSAGILSPSNPFEDIGDSGAGN